MTGVAGRALLGAIGFYRRAISPVLGPRCRFTPSCSEYAQEAVAVHGAGRGSWLALRRIAKCAPWHPGGVDLVPPSRSTGPAAGTAHPVHSSDTGTQGPSSTTPSTSSSTTSTGPRPTRAPRPPGRTPQQEAGVA